MPEQNDTSNFFAHAEYNEEYWDNYLTARPDYSAAFYNIIAEYHNTHHGSSILAHDVATGPGNVAAELIAQLGFERVVASDANETHLTVASHRLAQLVSEEKVEIRHCAAEALASVHKKEDVDLVTAAECMPLLDAETSLKAFAEVLKPGGTLAMWFYGRPIFAEPEFAAKCTPIFTRILNALFSKIIRGGGEQHKAGFKRATERLVSFLDDVELPAGTWKDVKRIKWNSKYTMMFYDIEACDFEVQVMEKWKGGKDGEEEVVEEIEDLGFWERKWDLDGVKRFVGALLPTFDRSLLETEEMVALWQKLGEAMGGTKEERRIGWPVVLILGSKR